MDIETMNEIANVETVTEVAEVVENVSGSCGFGKLGLMVGVGAVTYTAIMFGLKKYKDWKKAKHRAVIVEEGDAEVPRESDDPAKEE